MRTRLLLCILLVVVACDPGSDPTTRTLAPSATPSPSPTPTAAELPQQGNCRRGHAEPRPIIASRRARVMLLHPTDGRELCTLVTLDPSSKTTLDVEFAPDGRTVYLSDFRFGGCASIYSIDVGGGPVRVVVRGGYGPRISSDGKRLAYDASQTCGDRRHRMVVRDLKTGGEREWIGTWEGGYGGLMWSHDPRFLLVARSGADSARWLLFDTRRTGSLDGPMWPAVDDEDRPAGIELSYAGLTLTSPTVRPGHGTVAFGVAYSDVDGTEPYPVLEYQVRMDRWRVLIAGDAFPVDYDPTGESLLFWRRSSTKLKLFRYTNGRTFFLAKGFHDVSW